jgi:trehalose monomycolate/heme transporter
MAFEPPASVPDPVHVPPVRPGVDVNDAFQTAPQPSAAGPPKLVFRTAPDAESRSAPEPGGGAEAPWAPWADGPPQPRSPRTPRTKRVIVPNADGSGWHWGEEESDAR